MPKEILIAIIAASSALSGVMISAGISMLLSHIDRKHKKQVLLREKYEAMMTHFSASLVWIQSLNGSTSQKEVFALAQSVDARKSLSVALLYFPEFVTAANEYILAQQNYYASVVTSYNPNIPITAGGQAAVNSPNINEVTELLFAKKNAFENQMVASAPKYTKA